MTNSLGMQADTLQRIAAFIQTGELDELPSRYGRSKARQ